MWKQANKGNLYNEEINNNKHCKNTFSLTLFVFILHYYNIIILLHSTNEAFVGQTCNTR